MHDGNDPRGDFLLFCLNHFHAVIKEVIVLKFKYFFVLMPRYVHFFIIYFTCVPMTKALLPFTSM